MELITDLRKDEDTLIARQNEDLRTEPLPVPDSTTSKATFHSSSSFRLPRVELPTFKGDQESWRAFWDEFQNSLTKDPLLTDMDKLHFLQSSVKNEEGRDIISTGSRGGKDYEEIVRSLRSRYDRPRETCRIALHKYMQHELDPTHEGLGRTMSLLQKTISTLKECSDFTGPTIMAIMTELKMSETLFREWSKETSTMRKPLSAHQLIDFVEQYRRALAVQPGAAKQGSKLYQCSAFKEQSTEDRNSTAQRLRVCGNCLAYDHFFRECPSPGPAKSAEGNTTPCCTDRSTPPQENSLKSLPLNSRTSTMLTLCLHLPVLLSRVLLPCS